MLYHSRTKAPWKSSLFLAKVFLLYLEFFLLDYASGISLAQNLNGRIPLLLLPVTDHPTDTHDKAYDHRTQKTSIITGIRKPQKPHISIMGW